MNFNQLSEAVTKSKFDKYIKKINSDEVIRNRLSELNFDDEESVDGFLEEVFGEPTGIYKNTRDEQKLLIKRIQQDVHKDKGDSDLMRPVYTEI